MSDTRPIAVTGGTGFVGQAVLEEAGRQGLALRALTRRPQTAREDIEWIEGGLSSDSSLVRLVDGASAVIHIAGLTNAPDPTEFETANVAGTANVIAAMKQAGTKRLVFVSSLSAREPHLSRYGASKAKAEELVRASGLDWTIVRPPAVYGPRDIDMFDLFRSAKLGVVPLPPKGATSIIHVDDLSRLLLDLADAQPALVRNKVFEPDDGREGGWSHKELGRAIGSAVGRKVFALHLPKTVLEAAASADRLIRGKKAKLTADRVGYMAHPNWVVRSDRRVPEAVWMPQISGEEGLAQTARWYREQGWI